MGTDAAPDEVAERDVEGVRGCRWEDPGAATPEGPRAYEEDGPVNRGGEKSRRSPHLEAEPNLDASNLRDEEIARDENAQRGEAEGGERRHPPRST